MTHILASYGELTQLATPTQTKVELIKLAVFIRQLATRAWHPWDRVEIPPASLLKRLRIDDVAKILEQTHADAQAIIDFQASGGSKDREQDPPRKIEESGRKIIYANTPTLPSDFVAQLIRDMGIEIVPLSAENPSHASAVVINVIDAAEGDPRSEFALAEDVKSLVLTDRRGGASGENSEETLQRPSSYAGLRAALLERAAC